MTPTGLRRHRRWATAGFLVALAFGCDTTPASGPAPAPEDPAPALAESTFGIPLSAEDRATIRRFHDTFLGEGPRPQTLESFVESVEAGEYGSYAALLTRDAIDPRSATAQDGVAPAGGAAAGVLAVKVVLVLGLVGGLLLLPFGLPGVWIMVVLLLATLPVGWITWPTLLVLGGLALVAELLEFAVVKWMGDRYGGTRGSFWGAVVGGFAGVLVGLPVPLIGPVLAGCVGTFLGAAAVTLAGSRSVRSASRVGWGVMVARVLAVGLKVAVGVVVLVVGGGALFFFE